MIRPATTAVTLGYGATSSPYSPSNPHAGVDFSWQNDKNIYAPEDGTITFVGWMGSAGNATELTAGSHLHRMCHQSQILVAKGQQVRKGQVIGIMGETGTFADGSRSAFGVHLHWVMWVNGVRVNGLDYVNEGGDMPIPDADNYYGRYGVDLALKLRGRQLSREEFRQHIVGQSDLRAIEILSDDVEAQRVQHAQNVGMIAVRDKWDQQIYGLVDALKASNDTLAKVQAEAELSKALNAEVAKLKADNEKLAADNSKLMSTQASDVEAGQSFLRWLGQFVKQFINK